MQLRVETTMHDLNIMILKCRNETDGAVEFALL